MIAQQSPKRTKRPTQPRKARKEPLAKILISKELARTAQAHSIMMGGRGSRQIIEIALIEYFDRQGGKALTV